MAKTELIIFSPNGFSPRTHYLSGWPPSTYWSNSNWEPSMISLFLSLTEELYPTIPSQKSCQFCLWELLQISLLQANPVTTSSPLFTWISSRTSCLLISVFFFSPSFHPLHKIRHCLQHGSLIFPALFPPFKIMLAFKLPWDKCVWYIIKSDFT